MGLKRSAIRILKPLLPGARVLCLSYPDVLIPFEAAQQEYPSLKTSSFHGMRHGVDYALPETTEFLTALGAEEVTYVDVVREHGVEERFDLNIPSPLLVHEFGSFDLVIDPGTLEHCFNVGAAMVHAAGAVAEGGHIFHTPPMSMVNHGFWNFSPTVFPDFYDEENGFEIVTMWSEAGDQTEEMTIAEARSRMMVASERSLYCLARCFADVDEFRWPVQFKYRKGSR